MYTRLTRETYYIIPAITTFEVNHNGEEGLLTFKIEM